MLPINIFAIKIISLTMTLQCNNADEGRGLPEDEGTIGMAPPLIAFSEKIRLEQQTLKQFLRSNLYQHYRVARMSVKARRIVSDLFQAFLGERKLLPPEFQDRAGGDLPRAIADYIAGMTDRYAILEHRRLFAVEEI
jgi:dGTPase